MGVSCANPKPCRTCPEVLFKDLLQVVWERALRWLELPTTRNLLSQQARLIDLQEVPEAGTLVAVVAVDHHWLELVRNRRQLLNHALSDALGQTVAVVLVVKP